MPREVIQKGFIGGGRIECDGMHHYMVRDAAEAKKMNCPTEAPAGPCRCSDRSKKMRSRVIQTEIPVQKG